MSTRLKYKTNIRVRASVLALFALLFMHTFASAQRIDTAATLETSTLQPVSINVPAQHSPVRALTLSILPGAGQAYNRQAWKIPIIYAALGGVGYAAYNYYSQMAMFKEEYLFRVNHSDIPNLTEYAQYPTANIYNLYNSNNKNFQLFVFIEIGVYALNLVDAYIFGHLFDFEMDDNLTLQTYPTLQTSPLSRNGMVPGWGVSVCF